MKAFVEMKAALMKPMTETPAPRGNIYNTRSPRFHISGAPANCCIFYSFPASNNTIYKPMPP